MFQCCLDEDPDEVRILEDGAAGDDRPGDLDVVEGQDVDQRRGRPVGGGDLLGQPETDVELGLEDQVEEDLGQEGLDPRGAKLVRTAVAEVHQANEQPLAVRHVTALGEGHDLVHPVAQ
jgi:hypothetical protein